MDKIASPQDLRAELRNLIAYCNTPQPSRQIVASKLRSLANRVSAETTKKEWEIALKSDEKMLAKIREDIKKLEKGDEVENLTLPNAKQVEKALSQVVENKKRMLSKFDE